MGFEPTTFCMASRELRDADCLDIAANGRVRWAEPPLATPGFHHEITGIRGLKRTELDAWASPSWPRAAPTAVGDEGVCLDHLERLDPHLRVRLRIDGGEAAASPPYASGGLSL